MNTNILNLVESFFDDIDIDDDIQISSLTVLDCIEIGNLLWIDKNKVYYISDGSNESLQKAKDKKLKILGICYNTEDTIDFFSFIPVTKVSCLFDEAENATKIFRRKYKENWQLANIVDATYICKIINQYIQLSFKLFNYSNIHNYKDNKLNFWIYGIDNNNNIQKNCVAYMKNGSCTFILHKHISSRYFAFPVLTISDTDNTNILKNARLI